MAKDTNKKTKKEQNSSFIKDVKAELKKVTWPTSKELITSTATVILIALLLAVIVFVLDFGFEKANTYGVEKLKSIVSSSEENNNESEETENSDGIEIQSLEGADSDESQVTTTEETPTETTETPADSGEVTTEQ